MKSVQTTEEDTPELEARIIATIGSVGPRNVAEISRLTGAHQETVRYKIKRRFVEKGLRFQANVDFGKLGLSLYLGKFALSPRYLPSATKLFRSMNEVAYLVHFSKILPQGHFIALFSIPMGKVDEFNTLLTSLVQRGVFTQYSFDKILAQRHKTMDPTFFDFRRGSWNVDWEKVRRVQAPPLVAEIGRTEPLADYQDLLIIKELQKDARQHVAEIARKLKLNPKTVEYHYRAHVVGEALIPSYRIRWMKDTDEPLSRSALIVRLTFKNPKPSEYKSIQSVLTRVPYLWVEDLMEHHTYVATLAIPLSDFMSTMKYINGELRVQGQNVDIGYQSVEDSFNYTIPYHMFSAGGWQFDARKLQSIITERVLASIKK